MCLWAAGVTSDIYTEKLNPNKCISCSCSMISISCLNTPNIVGILCFNGSKLWHLLQIFRLFLVCEGFDL